MPGSAATDPVTAGRAPALLLQWDIDRARALIRELDDWHTADQARRRNELVGTTTHQRSRYSEIEDLAQQQREIRIDQFCDSLIGHVDLGSADRPWREADA